MKKLLCVFLSLVLLLALAACGAETEPVRNKENKPAATISAEDATQAEIKDGDPIIISVSVYHGDGEITSTRMSAVKGNTLTEVLLERTFITENKLTVDGEYANPELGNTWSLYIDGVYTSTNWDEVLLDNGVEYMFEYTSESSYEGDIEESVVEEGLVEEGHVEEMPEENVGEPEVTE